MRLTLNAIKQAKPGRRTTRLFDGGGFYLDVAPSGGKWWRLKYRYAGKEKRLSLGVFPEVNLRLARDRREDARRLLAANGVDPSEHRRDAKAAAAGGDGDTIEVEDHSHSSQWQRIAHRKRDRSRHRV